MHLREGEKVGKEGEEKREGLSPAINPREPIEQSGENTAPMMTSMHR